VRITKTQINQIINPIYLIKKFKIIPFIDNRSKIKNVEIMSNKRRDYYIRRKSKILKNFKERLKYIQKLLEEKYDEITYNRILINIQEEFNSIIPMIPYIGGQKNPLTQILVKCMSDLAVFRGLEKEGFSFQEIGEFHYNYVIKTHKARKEALMKAGRDPSEYPFDPVYIDYQKRLTKETQKRTYPDDWVIDFIEGDGKLFEWGWDIHECGVQKAFKKLGDEKYLPFICLGDFYEAEGLGFGFSRTQSLGFGGQKCTHRFVKNFKTPKAWPPYDLQEFRLDLWEK
jgi:hypothetical protein